jgi:aromatic amino acid aminotransferase I
MNPGYSDFEILLSSGSTDAWNKVVNLLCEFGDYILVEEHTYPSSQAVWAPMGCRGVPVSIDKDGMVPEALEVVLKSWNETHPGVKRPHLYVMNLTTLLVLSFLFLFAHLFYSYSIDCTLFP